MSNPIIITKKLPPFVITDDFLNIILEACKFKFGNLHKLAGEEVGHVSYMIHSNLSEMEQNFLSGYHSDGLFIFKCDNHDEHQGKVFFVFIPSGETSFKDCVYMAVEHSKGGLRASAFEEVVLKSEEGKEFFLSEAFPQQPRFFMGRYNEPVPDSLAILIADLSEPRP